MRRLSLFLMRLPSPYLTRCVRPVVFVPSYSSRRRRPLSVRPFRSCRRSSSVRRLIARPFLSQAGARFSPPPPPWRAGTSVVLGCVRSPRAAACLGWPVLLLGTCAFGAGARLTVESVWAQENGRCTNILARAARVGPLT